MKFDKNIEEILNAFIDGELSAEEAAEIQQLIDKNPKMKRLVHEIETCRLLVSSLPPAEPPAEMISDIKKLVQGHWSQGVRIGYPQSAGSSRIKLTQGHLFLFSRHLIAASIAIGLLGILAAVIYKIVIPETTINRTASVEQAKEAVTGNVKQVSQNQEEVGVYSLRLTTADFTGVDLFINKFLEESPWLQYQATKQLPDQSVYRVYCSREGIRDLMTGLTPVWSRFESATLVIQNESMENRVAVERVMPEQVVDIAKQKSDIERMKIARDFAVSNDIRRLLARENIASTANGSSAEPELMVIPKPVLTSGDKNLLVVPKAGAEKVQVDLSIVLSRHK